MHRVITDVEQVTPEWLTRVLYERGYLSRGQVTSVQKVNRPQHIVPFFADISFLQVGYSDRAPQTCPKRLCVKISKSSLKPAELSLGSREVEFYNTIASSMEDSPLARCYDAVYAPDTGKSHVLLDDLSETHFQPEAPLPPSKGHCELLVEGLARFHAHWWEHPRLGMSSGELANEAPNEDILGFPYSVRETVEMFPGFVDYLGDRLSATRLRLYEQALSSWPFPGLAGRFLGRRGLTLVHGDAHVWNFMFPRDVEHGRVCIIDWHEWGVSLATNDLAEMIGLWWYPERRARLEEPLLRRYHTQLLACGVDGYAWERCWNDYRLGVIRNLFTPVWMVAEGRPPATWWPILERVVVAFQDLKCLDLLQ